MFYQKYLHLVGPDITKEILQFLNNGGEFPVVNHTHIALIPKVKDSVSAKDFRPISLCNVLYKIISKTTANRLKSFLVKFEWFKPKCFCPGMQIFDNALVAYESVHYLKK